MLISLLVVALVAPEVTLSGVVLARSGRHAATLVSEGRARSVVAGGRAFGCEVGAIRPDSVQLVCGGESRPLRLAATAALPRGEASTPAAPVDQTPFDVTMTRADLEARLDREMSRLMTETTLVPVT